MSEKTTNDEVQKIENINVVEFIKNLPLDRETKEKLLLCIAAIHRDTFINTFKVATATAMGLDEKDPKFVAFYMNNIEPNISNTYSMDKVFEDMKHSIFGDEDSKEE